MSSAPVSYAAVAAKDSKESTTQASNTTSSTTTTEPASEAPVSTTPQQTSEKDSTAPASNGNSRKSAKKSNTNDTASTDESSDVDVSEESQSATASKDAIPSINKEKAASLTPAPVPKVNVWKVRQGGLKPGQLPSDSNASSTDVPSPDAPSSPDAADAVINGTSSSPSAQSTPVSTADSQLDPVSWPKPDESDKKETGSASVNSVASVTAANLAKSKAGKEKWVPVQIEPFPAKGGRGKSSRSGNSKNSHHNSSNSSASNAGSSSNHGSANGNFNQGSGSSKGRNSKSFNNKAAQGSKKPAADATKTGSRSTSQTHTSPTQHNDQQAQQTTTNTTSTPNSSTPQTQQTPSFPVLDENVNGDASNNTSASPSGSSKSAKVTPVAKAPGARKGRGSFNNGYATGESPEGSTFTPPAGGNHHAANGFHSNHHHNPHHHSHHAANGHHSHRRNAGAGAANGTTSGAAPTNGHAANSKYQQYNAYNGNSSNRRINSSHYSSKYYIHADYNPVYNPVFVNPISAPDPVQLVMIQLDYYMSVENLCKDMYLRRHMNGSGWISFSFLADFNRVRHVIHGDLSILLEAARRIESAEVSEDGTKVRPRSWANWILPVADRAPEAKEEDSTAPAKAAPVAIEPHKLVFNAANAVPFIPKSEAFTATANGTSNPSTASSTSN